jgi:DNA-binding MarR family transcriptional regulator
MATGVKKAAAKTAPRRAKANRSEGFGDLARQVRPGERDGTLAHSELSHSIGFLLRLASGVSQGRIGSKLDALDLRLSLYSVMLIIRENPGLKQQEVGRTLSIQQPNLVALINDLAGRGLVRREVNAGDRRSYSLALTPAGEKLLAQADKMHVENEQKLAALIAPMKVEDFEGALRRILTL